MRQLKEGKAYALFHSVSPLGDVRRELNGMKEAAGKLDALAIRTYRTGDVIQKGNETGIPLTIVAMATKNGANYIIKAEWSGEDNGPTASALDDVLRVRSEFFVPQQATVYYIRDGGSHFHCFI